MIEKFNHILSAVHSLFINLIHLSTMLIIIGLCCASGYTTYKGMVIFIDDWWIAVIITIAVQAIIVLCAFELSNTYFRAHKLRYIGLVISLAIGIGVSVNFSYLMFYQRGRLDSEKVNRFQKMNGEVEAYLEELDRIKSNFTKEKLNRIEVQKQRLHQAILGTLTDVPEKYQVLGRGLVSREIQKQVREEEASLNRFQDGFKEIEDRRKTFVDNAWSSKIVNDRSAFDAAVQSFASLSNLASTVLGSFGQATSSKPQLTSWGEFIQLSPPYAIVGNLSLALAIIIDILAFIFSTRLRSLPVGELSKAEEEIAYRGISEFTEVDLNTHDQNQIGLEKTGLEEGWGINDLFRKSVVALLINKGFLRRVDRNHVEFTPRFYSVYFRKKHEELQKQEQVSQANSTQKVSHLKDHEKSRMGG